MIDGTPFVFMKQARIYHENYDYIEWGLNQFSSTNFLGQINRSRFIAHNYSISGPEAAKAFIMSSSQVMLEIKKVTGTFQHIFYNIALSEESIC
jgi:putative IMPACT (imprinted ancient) family translation regulator